MSQHTRQIDTFMRRKAHLSQTAKSALLQSKRIYPLDALDTHHLDLNALFHSRAPLTLEIGFGMGDSLLEMASNAPELNFVGVEVHQAGIGRLAHLADEARLSNLVLIEGDALRLLDALETSALARVLLFFPDPWQKKRHHKRRFVQPWRMDKVTRALKIGGIFHTATDWAPYAQHMLEVLDGMDALRNLHPGFAPRPDARPMTKFEKRGLLLGHEVFDILMQRA